MAKQSNPANAGKGPAKAGETPAADALDAAVDSGQIESRGGYFFHNGVNIGHRDDAAAFLESDAFKAAAANVVTDAGPGSKGKPGSEPEGEGEGEGEAEGEGEGKAAAPSAPTGKAEPLGEAPAAATSAADTVISQRPPRQIESADGQDPSAKGRDVTVEVIGKIYGPGFTFQHDGGVRLVKMGVPNKLTAPELKSLGKAAKAAGFAFADYFKVSE